MRVHLEWGLPGARALLGAAEVFIVVDTLSFSTCVDVACARGAEVIPHPFDRPAAQALAARLGAELARSRHDPEAAFTLSPASLDAIAPGTRLILPSPNGSAICAALVQKTVFAGCLRNAGAVARAAQAKAEGGAIAVIPAGEHWPDGSLRWALEDILGAGAILAGLDGPLSPEAETAKDAFHTAEGALADRLFASVSGRELVGLGFAQDVEFAARLNCSNAAPMLQGGAFRA